MARVTVKLNKAGFAALRNSPEVMADLNRRATRIANAAGEGFAARLDQRGSSSMSSRPRARASVGTTDAKSIRKNAKENTLMRALDAGR